MNILIEDRVYEPITVYDYQAVCYDDRLIDYDALMKKIGNSASNILLWNPLKYFVAVFATLLNSVYAVPAYMANRKY